MPVADTMCAQISPQHLHHHHRDGPFWENEAALSEPDSPPPPQTEDDEEECRGTPGRVKDMIALFQHYGQENGSEPSINGRTGHRFSVTTTSRKAVTSPEGLSPTQTSSSSWKQDSVISAPTSHSPVHSGGAPMASTTIPQIRMESDLSSSASPPKMPSYLKIACSVGGYNKYSAYNTAGNERKPAIRVIKNSTHQKETSTNHSDSSNDASFSSQSSRISDASSHQTNGSENNEDSLKNSVDHVDSAKIVQRTNHNSNKLNTSSENDLGSGNLLLTNGDHRLNGDDNSSDGSHKEGHSSQENLLNNSDLFQKDDNLHHPAPAKDGHYFLKIMETETARIKTLITLAEKSLDTSIPEEASGKIRAATGKANLLISRKFKQFQGLCEKNLNQAKDAQFPTTDEDLAGFWDMVTLQVDDIVTMFEQIELSRRNGWQSPVRRGNVTKTSKKSAHGKSDNTAKTSTLSPRSAKSLEANKARELARKRLLEAKKAGRQRKASQSDKDEIEIFVQ